MKYCVTSSVKTAPIHRRGIAVVAALALPVALSGLGLLLPATPSMAADCTASMFATDFNDAADGATVPLGCDVTIVAADELPLEVSAGRFITLDLNGHTLEVTGTYDHAGIAVPAGTGLEIIGSGGALIATGGYYGAGIGGGNGADAGTIAIAGGTVTATGGYYGAGIGGGSGGGGGSIAVTGGTVTATGFYYGAGIGGGRSGGGGSIALTGGTVDAVASISGEDPGTAAAIGGGLSGAGGEITIGADTGGPVHVTARGGALANAVGGGQGGVLGDITVGVTGTLTLESEIAVPSGGTITNSGSIRGTGPLTGAGTIDNGGAIWRTMVIGDDLSVTDHHFGLSFDPNGGQVDWGAQTQFSIVDGPDLASVGRGVDGFPLATQDGETFVGWFLDAEQTEGPVTDLTTFSGSSSDGTAVPVTLHAGWQSAGPGTIYAYPNGGTTSVTSCPTATTLAQACTLEQALALAQSGDTVILAADPGTDDATFTTSTGWEVPQDSLVIRPEAGSTAALDGGQIAPHLLDFAGTGTLTITDLTVADSVGHPDISGPGGGIINRRGVLTVARSTFSGNRAADGYGGGILNWSSTSKVTVTGSTFVDNDVTGVGGGGGILNLAGGTVSVSQSTFTGNDGPSDGVASSYLNGGVTGGGGHVVITSSTFVDNEVQALGLTSAQVTLGASLLAGSGELCWGHASTPSTLVDLGYNLSADDSCGFTAAESVNGSRHLAGLVNPLADNGGPTKTITPKPGSPALDIIPTGTSVTVNGEALALCPATDQRGVTSQNGEPCHAGSVQAVAGAPLSVATDALPNGIVGTDYGPAEIQAAGGTGPYSFSVSAGALPEGLNLNVDTGAIDGAPTKAGTATFTVEISDANDLTLTKALSIGIAPGPAVQIPSTPLAVVTTELPDGTVGLTYRRALKASGSGGGYRWSLTDGVLPAGLDLSRDGVLSGKPTESGTFSFTVSVNDRATGDLTLVVNPGSAAPGGLPMTGAPTGTLLASIAGLLLILAGGAVVALRSRRGGRTS